MRRLCFKSMLLLGAAPLLLTLAWAPPIASAQTIAPSEYVPGEVLLKLHPTSSLEDVADDYELELLDQFGSRPIFRMAIDDDDDDDELSPPALAAALAADPRVAAAEPNFVGQTPEGVAKSSWAGGDGHRGYTDQWAAGTLRLSSAHGTSRGGGVTVAVLDTGVDASHTDLAGRVGPGFDFVDHDADAGEEGSDDDESFGHGTHVAGLVALTAPDATIMPVRMLTSSGDGNLWVLLEALEFAVNPDGNPQTSDDSADVINLSFSFQRESRLLEQFAREVTCEDDDHNEAEDLCDATGGRGAVFVAAAGNSGSSAFEYPAAEQVVGLLAVAASAQNDTLASFSNNGSWIHLAAPGDGIVSSVPGGYGVWSGTSMATPFVAGTAALVRAREPNLLPSAVASRIVASATDIGGVIPRRLDAASALGIPRPAPTVGDVQCRGTLGAVIATTVTVPRSAQCTLNGTRVTGDIKVGSGATLNATGVTVGGSVEGIGVTMVALTSSSVGGSVVVKEGSAATLDRVTIGGSVQLEKNRRALRVTGSTISGSLQAKENSGGLTIQSNTSGTVQAEKNQGILPLIGNIINGDVQVKENSGTITIRSNQLPNGALKCENNSPTPTGGGNVAKQREGQCARL
jgi:thermitase